MQNLVTTLQNPKLQTTFLSEALDHWIASEIKGDMFF